eukprot:scaffold40247_cov36-Cyclotella_meneghiniana.AAC.3
MSDIKESEDKRSGNVSVGTDTSAVTINTTGDHDTIAYILLDESMCQFTYRSSTKSHKARMIVCGRPAGGALGYQCTSHRNKPAEKYRLLDIYFGGSMDSTWDCGTTSTTRGFANITIKMFLTHFRDNVAKQKTKEKKELRKRIEFEWNQTQDIKEYFQRMIEQRMKLESRGIIITDEDMVETAVTQIQMQDSGLFD